MRIRSVLVLAALSASLLLHADEGSRVSFPGCKWTETTVSVTSKRAAVTGPDGKPLLSFSAEPRGASLAKLVLKPFDDRLLIDATDVFADGVTKITINARGLPFAKYAGRDTASLCEFGGARGSSGQIYFEGRTKGPKHYYKRRGFETKGHPKKFPMIEAIPEDIEELHVRLDIASAKGPIEFFGYDCGLLEEMPEATPTHSSEKPQLLFRATFEGTTEAVKAGGQAKALTEKGITFAEGIRGQAVRLSSKNGSVLDYSAAGNLVQERGAVSFWFKREWPDDGRNAKGGDMWRTMFSNPSPRSRQRVGSGQLWFWFIGPRLRADQSDDDDAYAGWSGKQPGDGWHHLVVSWSPSGVRMYLDGRSASGQGDSDSPMRSALKNPRMLSFDRASFDRFCVGHLDGGRQFDGLIDDLCIFSEPLNEKMANKLWRREQDVELKGSGCYAIAGTPGEPEVLATNPSKDDVSKFRYCVCDESDKVVKTFGPLQLGKKVKLSIDLPAGRYTIRATDGERLCGSMPYLVMRAENPYELKTAAKHAGVPEGMKLVEELKLDKLPPADRYRSVGQSTIKQLGGVSYLEAAPAKGSRYAIRFKLDDSVPLYCFEIDYPDDAVRTADIIIQRVKNPNNDYTMQVGYMVGGEYPSTGKILTHRCLYWTYGDDVALIAMTARENAPAAISAVRVYRVEGAALPPAVAKMPKRADGWRRSVALYYEDPAIGYDYATSGHGIDEIEELINRTAASMKFAGENLFAYPGVWYGGLIGDWYNPRRHAPDYLSAWYTKFDKEGLEFIPTLNFNTLPVKEGLVTRVSMRNGTLHDSPISIHSTGLPNWGGWHGSPPNFNFFHPYVRESIMQFVDALVEQGKSHPSFKGICCYLTQHTSLWFGDPESGYNDYAIDAFSKAKGIKVPVDRKDPLRGKAYAKWLRENAWDKWVQWRCDYTTAFYAQVARKLAAARPDLKLWLNSFVPTDMMNEGFGDPGHMDKMHRERGLDRVKLTAAIPNLVLGQTAVPADYRVYPSNYYPSEQVRTNFRDAVKVADAWSLLKDAKCPWLNIHDRYWENAIGKEGKRGSSSSLSCDWLTETTWRVSTINPGGENAMQAIVGPLKHGDILGFSKGGFLIGTYGMEDYLAPFAQAFRSLPAVVFDDVGSVGDVVVRQKDFDGKSWFYVVNTGAKPASVAFSAPAGTTDLVTGASLDGKATLALRPYEFRSFSAPKGRPSVGK
jgi:hypothetical protein